LKTTPATLQVGLGLFQLANGNQDPVLNAFNPPSAGRDARRDAITEYVKTVRTPRAPEAADDPDVQAGRSFFKKAGCVRLSRWGVVEQEQGSIPGAAPGG
jgi:hypothetical protein